MYLNVYYAAYFIEFENNLLKNRMYLTTPQHQSVIDVHQARAVIGMPAKQGV
jgi:hypothetical protein